MVLPSIVCLRKSKRVRLDVVNAFLYLLVGGGSVGLEGRQSHSFGDLPEWTLVYACR